MVEKIRHMLEDALSKKDLRIDRIVYEKEGNNYFLRIIIDKDGIVDLDTCVEATHIINDILDKENPIEESYILDVSSKEKGGN